jgi:hypothetical protein
MSERMDIAAAIAGSLSGWVVLPDGADPAVVATLMEDAPVPLPPEYVGLLLAHDGGEGRLGREPGWFRLWPAGEVLRWNREYEILDGLPGFFAIGTNGGGEMLAFDCRREMPWPIVMVPLIAPEPGDALIVAENFNEFARLLGRECPEGARDAPRDDQRDSGS